jgi:hypothetical protein
MEQPPRWTSSLLPVILERASLLAPSSTGICPTHTVKIAALCAGEDDLSKISHVSWNPARSRFLHPEA